LFALEAIKVDGNTLPDEMSGEETPPMMDDDPYCWGVVKADDGVATRSAASRARIFLLGWTIIIILLAWL
jgi:hypothetical protein